MNSPNTHAVVGAGPVGTTVALLLAQRGTPVLLLSRSGTGPDHHLVTHARVDAADAQSLSAAVDGASALYNCVNPPYHRWPTDWPPIHRALLAAAERSGAVLVMMDNLYVFGPGAAMPMAEGDPPKPHGPKGVTRAAMATELFEAHQAGRIRATLARAADFFGPRVTDAQLGERVVPRVLAAKKVSLLGSLDTPHSYSYMPDVAETLVTIASDERAWGKPWHVPNAGPLTQRQMVEALARAAGTRAAVRTVPWPVVRAAGLFSPMIRELAEIRYQVDEPFVTDSTLTESTFGLTATPVDTAVEATVAWWRSRSSA